MVDTGLVGCCWVELPPDAWTIRSDAQKLETRCQLEVRLSNFVPQEVEVVLDFFCLGTGNRFLHNVYEQLSFLGGELTLLGICLKSKYTVKGLSEVNNNLH